MPNHSNNLIITGQVCKFISIYFLFHTSHRHRHGDDVRGTKPNAATSNPSTPPPRARRRRGTGHSHGRRRTRATRQAFDFEGITVYTPEGTRHSAHARPPYAYGLAPTRRRNRTGAPLRKDQKCVGDMSGPVRNQEQNRAETVTKGKAP